MNRTLFFVLFSTIVQPVLSSHAAWVATSSPESTKVAQQILKDGGNAIDAACAAFFVQSVTQSYFTGIGGGGFAVLETKGKVHHYDFREVAPASVHSKWFSSVDLNSPNSWNLRNTGGISAGVPGNVAGCDLLVRKHGKLKWKQVIQPAIDYAKNGFTISKLYEEELAEQWSRIRSLEPTQTIFKGQKGSGLKQGEQLIQPDLQITLERLANEGSQSFYHGKFAQDWAIEAQKAGAKITANDLNKYKVISRKPIRFEFGPYLAETAAPSSAAGWMVGAVLRFISHYHQKYSIPAKESIQRKILEIEAIHHFGTLRQQTVSDPKKTKIHFESWYGSKEEKKSWDELELKIQKRFSSTTASAAFIGTSKKESSHTSNISVLDDQGNAIAMTSSVGEIFGSGITVPNFGFLLNSTLGDFSPQPENINAPGSGLRPRSNISPTLVYEKSKKGKKLVAVLGAAGGPLIPQSIVQFFINYTVYGMSGSDAIRDPRIGVSYDGSVEIEKSAGNAWFQSLKKAGYDVTQTDVVWAVFNGIVRRNSSTKEWESVTESRY